MADKNRQALVFMSDFGLQERFVASMKGVAYGVDPALKMFDLTHLIEPYNIWEAAQVLAGTITYWPPGTVFVAVVDPGVGTDRKSVVARTAPGHYIVTPDNGTLTFVAEQFGITALREIDERINRRPASQEDHTFHGRDVYAYTGARLASGVIDFEGVGPKMQREAICIAYQKAERSENAVTGTITKIEKPFGNLVTNIPRALWEEAGFDPARAEPAHVRITQAGRTVYENDLPYVFSFGQVEAGQDLLYPDSLKRIGLARNGGHFSETHGVKAGPDWLIQLRRPG